MGLGPVNPLITLATQQTIAKHQHRVSPGIAPHRRKRVHMHTHVTLDPAGKRVLDRLDTSSGKLVHLHAGHRSDGGAAGVIHFAG